MANQKPNDLFIISRGIWRELSQHPLLRLVAQTSDLPLYMSESILESLRESLREESAPSMKETSPVSACSQSTDATDEIKSETSHDDHSSRRHSRTGKASVCVVAASSKDKAQELHRQLVAEMEKRASGFGKSEEGKQKEATETEKEEGALRLPSPPVSVSLSLKGLQELPHTPGMHVIVSSADEESAHTRDGGSEKTRDEQNAEATGAQERSLSVDCKLRLPVSVCLVVLASDGSADTTEKLLDMRDSILERCGRLSSDTLQKTPPETKAEIDSGLSPKTLLFLPEGEGKDGETLGESLRGRLEGFCTFPPSHQATKPGDENDLKEGEETKKKEAEEGAERRTTACECPDRATSVRAVVSLTCPSCTHPYFPSAKLNTEEVAEILKKVTERVRSAVTTAYGPAKAASVPSLDACYSSTALCVFTPLEVEAEAVERQQKGPVVGGPSCSQIRRARHRTRVENGWELYVKLPPEKARADDLFCLAVEVALIGSLQEAGVGASLGLWWDGETGQFGILMTDAGRSLFEATVAFCDEIGRERQKEGGRVGQKTMAVLQRAVTHTLRGVGGALKSLGVRLSGGRQLVHGDIKEGQICVLESPHKFPSDNEGGEVTVIDWGISSLIEASSGKVFLGYPGDIPAGSSGYFSPETAALAQRNRTSPSKDVFSSGRTASSALLALMMAAFADKGHTATNMETAIQGSSVGSVLAWMETADPQRRPPMRTVEKFFAWWKSNWGSSGYFSPETAALAQRNRTSPSKDVFSSGRTASSALLALMMAAFADKGHTATNMETAIQGSSVGSVLAWMETADPQRRPPMRTVEKFFAWWKSNWDEDIRSLLQTAAAARGPTRHHQVHRREPVRVFLEAEAQKNAKPSGKTQPPPASQPDSVLSPRKEQPPLTSRGTQSPATARHAGPERGPSQGTAAPAFYGPVPGHPFPPYMHPHWAPAHPHQVPMQIPQTARGAPPPPGWPFAVAGGHFRMQ
uniref:Protein kinase domain-containing protein n=1 Tax=Chromera velia CCMP2878 TaxID=1169474 RepID=A0A0G4GGR8_9ALVE|eukprot:Cvel_21831.t1-p1 / transcript=Cvel_21831.t1 / gene=Cvel_21831 / organism=Chromera_velia_CCMP2878 / gene_product=hypothetical protein / transcript_product=hypothetical protein / location=Cvel_scaffold2084:7319-13052(-) / protein_length=978 / sequence_SO=supercontig / SO=protein_coding / is_pseudo=false